MREVQDTLTTRNEIFCLNIIGTEHSWVSRYLVICSISTEILLFSPLNSINGLHCSCSYRGKDLSWKDFQRRSFKQAKGSAKWCPLLLYLNFSYFYIYDVHTENTFSKIMNLILFCCNTSSHYFLFFFFLTSAKRNIRLP